ncbi:Ferredoxin [Mycobacteroides franklinii]|uniref:Ferredoxin n=1 Tax=Mycobacteroides franklinii TaxID=948102 RepID=A0A4V3HVG3_9MYCO|nr:Ferredoxin [Mycobacteroides franklinii]TDZ52103.1 Ferredoxin [Mycobacteroides franklinii]TDZ55510.1 Ferredoxin [Mycobacteroides franklinii]TDZ62451.1 Ferredoxin [Mycobacteroides franklinii]TDZ68848.1 Ferredoxin [Mycobacteroides franklinii]
MPGEWSGYVRANADFFADLGVTSSARRAGKIDRDAPLVAQLPRRTGRACWTPDQVKR